MPLTTEPVHLSEQQWADLSEIAQARSLPVGFVFRAKLSEGLTSILNSLRLTSLQLQGRRKVHMI